MVDGHPDWAIMTVTGEVFHYNVDCGQLEHANDISVVPIDDVYNDVRPCPYCVSGPSWAMAEGGTTGSDGSTCGTCDGEFDENGECFCDRLEKIGIT